MSHTNEDGTVVLDGDVWSFRVPHGIWYLQGTYGLEWARNDFSEPYDLDDLDMGNSLWDVLALVGGSCDDLISKGYTHTQLEEMGFMVPAEWQGAPVDEEQSYEILTDYWRAQIIEQRDARNWPPPNGYWDCVCCGLTIIGSYLCDHCKGCDACATGKPEECTPDETCDFEFAYHCFTAHCDGSGCTYPGQCEGFESAEAYERSLQDA